MKKYFLMAIMAATTLSFMSCDKKDKEEAGGSEEPTTTPIVVLSENELDLPQGYVYQLNATVSPAKDVAITWTSSNEKIAYVDEDGNVYGIDYGTANIIASAEGYKADTCVVTVYDLYSAITWGGFCLMNFKGDSILSNDTLKTKIKYQGASKEVSCVMAYAEYAVWDDNISMDANGYLYGTGFFTELPGTVWVIADALDAKGPNYYYLGTDGVYVIDYDKFNWNDTANAYCCAAGKYGDVNAHYEWYQKAMTGEADLNNIPEFKGGVLQALEFNGPNGAKWTGDYFYGFAGNGIFAGDETMVYYKAYYNWFDGDQFLGLKLAQDPSTGKWDIKEPAEWANLKSRYYENLPAAGAPALKAKSADKLGTAKEVNFKMPKISGKKLDKNIKPFSAVKF